MLSPLYHIAGSNARKCLLQNGNEKFASKRLDNDSFAEDVDSFSDDLTNIQPVTAEVNAASQRHGAQTKYREAGK